MSSVSFKQADFHNSQLRRDHDHEEDAGQDSEIMAGNLMKSWIILVFTLPA